MPKKVLVVEDSDDVTFMMATYLESAGYEVIAAKDGFEAIEQALNHCPDIILMDIGLPNLDGLGAARIIKSTEHCTDIPIIAVTAFRDIRESAILAGCTDLVEKPVDLGHLEAVLGTHLGV